MTYARHLAAALRLRDASEDFIADVIRETEGLGLRDEALEEELGSPYDYAEQLRPGPMKKRVRPVLAAFLWLALLWVIFVFTAHFWGWNAKQELGFFFTFPAWLAMVIGFIAQSLVDYFRPIDPRTRRRSLGNG